LGYFIGGDSGSRTSHNDALKSGAMHQSHYKAGFFELLRERIVATIIGVPETNV
jgi:hypothetical protein